MKIKEKMLSSKFIIFFAVVTVLSFLIDFYVIYNYKNIFTNNKNKSIFYKTALIISILLSIISFVNSIDRMFYHNIIKDISNLLLMITTIWFFPKLFFLPILFLKDVIKLILNLIKFLFKIDKNNSITKNNQINRDNNQLDFESDSVKNSDLELNKENNKITKREFLRDLTIGISSLPFIVVGYGVFVTTKEFQIIKQTLHLKNLPTSFENFKILQISDLHSGSLSSNKLFLDTFLAIKKYKPDLILVTGDFVNSNPEELKPYIEDLQKYDAKHGVYGCLGNHDHYMNYDKHQQLLKYIEMSGVKLLNNQTTKIYNGYEYINLAGVDNWGMNQQFGDFDKVSSEIDFSTTSILMCHDPNNFRRFILNKIPIDITLSGHTHGGQIGLVSDRFNLLPVKLFYEFSAGKYQINNQYLYVNRGFGTTGPPLRIGINPEITILTLVKDDSLS